MTEHEHQGPNGQRNRHNHNHGEHDHGHDSMRPFHVWTWHAVTVSCAQCGHSGPPQLFEPFNAAGNLACKAQTLCQLRQQGTDPAALLGTLLREFAAHQDGKSGELDTLTTRQLAELDLDLRGPRGEFMGGCSGAVRVYLGSRGDSAQAIADTEADRLARRRRRAALQAAETRRRNKAAG